jgi:DNA-binding FrmR family transcriptional regulator
MNRISAEARLLLANHIETHEELSAYRGMKQDEKDRLAAERTNLRGLLKRKEPPEDAENIRSQIAAVTARLKTLRRDIRLCDDIAARSGVIRNKVSDISDRDRKREEVNENAIRRRSR